MKKNNKFIKTIIFIIFLSVLLYLVKYYSIFDKSQVESLINSVKYKQNFAVILILLATVLTIFFVPISWLVIFSSIIFGAFKGLIYMTIAANISATVCFFIGRIYRQEVNTFIMNRFNKKKLFNRWEINIDNISKNMKKYGGKYIFLMRNIPILPFTVVNYLSGVTTTGFKGYILATSLGMLPGMAVTSYLFSTVASINNIRELTIPFILAILYYSLVFVITFLYMRQHI